MPAKREWGRSEELAHAESWMMAAALDYIEIQICEHMGKEPAQPL